MDEKVKARYDAIEQRLKLAEKYERILDRAKTMRRTRMEIRVFEDDMEIIISALRAAQPPAAPVYDLTTEPPEDLGRLGEIVERDQRISAGTDRAAGLTDAQLDDLRSHIRGSQPNETGTYEYELGSGWRCFHCGEMFQTWGGASLHFGNPADKRPTCVPTEPQAGSMRDALEPFARLGAIGCWPDYPDEFVVCSFRDKQVTVGDLRKASAALPRPEVKNG